MNIIFNNIKDYLLIIDGDNKIRFCNDSLLKKLLYDESNLINLNISKISVDTINLNKNEIINIYSKNRDILSFNFKNFDIKWKDEDCKILILQELEKKSYTIDDLEQILDNLPLISWIKDLTGKYIYVNKAYANIFNSTKDDFLGKTDTDLWPEDARKLKDEDNLIAKEKINFTRREQRIGNNTKSWFYVFKGALLDNDGKSKYTYGSAVDITENKRLEEDRSLLEKEIELDRLRIEFFSNISHEFKTPINIIFSVAQLLEKYVQAKTPDLSYENQIEYFSNMLKKNSYRLLRLVNNLLDITKIESGNYDGEFGNFDIVSLVENIVISSANHIQNKEISLVFDTNEEEKIMRCNPYNIEKIVLNLISNAIKYNKGDIKVNVILDIYEDKVKIHVKDNGIGMSKEYIESIFYTFSQADKSLNRKCEGCGIGLSLVRSLVDIHDGYIEVKSEIDKGSEFIVTLPVKYINEENNTIDSYKKVENCNLEFSDIYSI